MRHGFSLVELSIVLVILGLLTGGILAGQNLIRAAELRSVITDFQKHQTAVMTFREKYFALPGDMRNAIAFWGEAHATPSTCITTLGTGTQTCDGNGNGKIGNGNTGSATNTEDLESFRAWQHLANAGLIEGTYTGKAPGTDYRDARIGENVPSSKIGNAGFNIHSVAPGTNGWMFLNTTPSNYLLFGERRAGSGGALLEAAINNEEAWNIDKKSDDGKPGTGAITTGSNTHSPDCADSDTSSDAIYQLNNAPSKACFLVMTLGF